MWIGLVYLQVRAKVDKKENSPFSSPHDTKKISKLHSFGNVTCIVMYATRQMCYVVLHTNPYNISKLK